MLRCLATRRMFSTDSFYPTKQFLHRHVRRPSQKERFVQIVAEIQIYREIFKNSRCLNFDDEMWQILMNMLNWEERYKYLLELGKSTKGEKEEDIVPISTRNQQRLENGEMVYARDFHSLVDIYGAEFRKKVDNAYGVNLLKQRHQIPEFIVDCRFLREYSVVTQAKYIRQMQSLHDDNWFSTMPMKIHFANYKPDQQLAAIAKKNLLFRYGPEGKVANFQPHPFAPHLTSRRISQIVKKENLLYITTRATRYLPDVLPENIQGVVYCLSNESSPSTSGQTAAISENIQPYRIPFKKFVSSDLRPTSLHLFQIAKIMREYFQGSTIRDSILGNVQRHNSAHKSRTEDDSKIEEFRSAMHHINNCSTN